MLAVSMLGLISRDQDACAVLTYELKAAELPRYSNPTKSLMTQDTE